MSDECKWAQVGERGGAADGYARAERCDQHKVKTISVNKKNCHPDDHARYVTKESGESNRGERYVHELNENVVKFEEHSQVANVENDPKEERQSRLKEDK